MFRVLSCLLCVSRPCHAPGWPCPRLVSFALCPLFPALCPRSCCLCSVKTSFLFFCHFPALFCSQSTRPTPRPCPVWQSARLAFSCGQAQARLFRSSCLLLRPFFVAGHCFCTGFATPSRWETCSCTGLLLARGGPFLSFQMARFHGFPRRFSLCSRRFPRTFFAFFAVRTFKKDRQNRLFHVAKPAFFLAE